VAQARSQFTLCQRDIVYGPVESRRLGPSIGINLFPGEYKACPLDCLYCFISNPRSSDPPANPVTADAVIDALNDFFSSPATRKDAQRASFITFSGNGEPTYHPQFAAIAQRVEEWRNTNASDKKLAIFSNGMFIAKRDVRDAMMIFDRVFLKLDWGSQEEFERISRPRISKKLDDIVEELTSYVRDVRASRSKQATIIQTAIYNHNRLDSSWVTWAAYVKKIMPDEVQLYELNFEGADYAPDPYLNFNEFQRRIIPVLRFELLPVRYFYHGSTFSIPVNLCLAVDSLIYLPVYFADFCRLFEENAVQVSHFVSPDGDPGAVAALVRGEAQFALCDPQAAIDYLSDSKNQADQDAQPVIVALLINKLALWAVSNTGESGGIGDVIDSADKIVTYNPGSTANYVWRWQQAKHARKRRAPVLPGGEFADICSGEKNVCVITADVLGATWCRQNCGGPGVSSVSYAETRLGRLFLFTGLLSTRGFVKRYPTVVNGVVSALLEANRSVYDELFMDKHRAKLIEYLSTLFSRKRPKYFGNCTTLKGVPEKVVVGKLVGAVREALHELIRLQIYSSDGKIRRGELWNALKIRVADRGSQSRPSIRIVFTLVDKNAGSLWTRTLMAMSSPLLALAVARPLYLGFLSFALALATFASTWKAVVTRGVESGVWYGLGAIVATLSGAAILALILSIQKARGGEL
jgi:wyosine [tRNA(Phe)-imidazoG37] synthetase (radical SAM superfamily)